jgi:branched-chain amino acid transport system ATP-binding protein
VTALLEIAGLRAGYGRAAVLHGIDLVVQPKQIVTVIGPNGAGKTTAMHAIMNLLPATGTRRLDGADIAGIATEELVGRGLLLVPETRALFADMTVAENLELGAYARRGASMRDVFAVFPRLEERRSQVAGTLSGGERQMLALGRALMGRPRLLLLDEPSLGLAPRIVRDIFRTLDGLRRDGLAMVLVEQNARAALALADEGAVLEMGRITAAGPAAALRNDARVLATYLGQARTTAAEESPHGSG